MREKPCRAAARRDRAGDPLSARRAHACGLHPRCQTGSPSRPGGGTATQVCCGLTGHLELARRPDLYGTPVIIGRWDEHAVAVSEEAAAFGVAVGMAMRHAEHLCPQATFVLPDEEATVRIRELISAALYDLAPVVEVRDDGVVWIDLEGVARPGESIREMRRRLLQAIGREPRLGLAP